MRDNADLIRRAADVKQALLMALKHANTAVLDGTVDERDAQVLAAALDQTRGCHLFFVLKDTHTISHEPWRLARWVELAREEIDAFATRSAPPTMARACPG